LLKGSQRTILFLIADTGAGHRSAANALRNAINIMAEDRHRKWLEGQQRGTDVENTPEPPTYRIEIVDVFEEYGRFPLREAVKLYGPAIRYNPSLYGRFFHMTDRARSVEAVKTVARPMVHKGLLRLITSVQPDVIVSIHPMLNHVTIEAIADLGLKIPFLTVVTDLISVHHSWYAPGADGYIVPTEQARRLYIRRGLEPGKVHVLGMPIDPKFTLPLPGKEDLRRKFGLDCHLPTVLLMGGGDGAGGLRSAVQAISQARLPVQLLVITGRNKRLFVHLQRMRADLKVPAKIYGFVHNVPEMMHAADVIVTKAGPGSICEALACNLPIILSGFVPGQEEGNVTFVTENKVGVLARTPVELIDALRRLIKPGSQVLQEQLENARRLSRPQASFDIVECILSYLPPPGEASIWQSSASLHPVHIQRRSQRPAILQTRGRRFPLRVAAVSPRSLRNNIARLGVLRQPTTRATGPLDARAVSRRLPHLIGRVGAREEIRSEK
jgi:1,2-diacylglycerol 3-beta-galactosyltransferase